MSLNWKRRTMRLNRKLCLKSSALTSNSVVERESLNVAGQVIHMWNASVNKNIWVLLVVLQQDLDIFCEPFTKIEMILKKCFLFLLCCVFTWYKCFYWCRFLLNQEFECSWSWNSSSPFLFWHYYLIPNYLKTKIQSIIKHDFRLSC